MTPEIPQAVLDGQEPLRIGEAELWCGDCRDILAALPAESVRTVVTSPPYFGLRDYGTAQWDGGDPECQHTGVARRCDKPGRKDKQSTQKGSSSDPVSRVCLRCGARRIDRQVGLEDTPAAYVETMVEVFRAVRRVLRDDGTVWLNLGDSYASGGGTGRQGSRGQRFDRRHTQETLGEVRRWPEASIKPKDLIGIPWRVAFALQADGWYLRQDLIWSKPNPMPESVTDRCTKAHEYIFLLSKRERYWFDAAAIRERGSNGSHGSPNINPGWKQAACGNNQGGSLGKWTTEDAAAGRNRRSVWTVATQPYAGAHFATFPPDLIRPCILAGCPKGGVVLDPFGGSGTSAAVALALGRKAVICELSPSYLALAAERLGRRDDQADLFMANEPRKPTQDRML